MDVLRMWALILISCLPAAVIGLLFDEHLEALFYKPVPVAMALLVFGAAFLLLEHRLKGREFAVQTLEQLSPRLALYIGLFQVLAAVFPGTSRSGATIVGALLLGISRTVAAEYTFFLAIPVMFGASLLKALRFDGALSGQEGLLLTVGSLVAFGVSVLALRFLIQYVKKRDFVIFGWYRIALAAAVLLYFGFFA